MGRDKALIPFGAVPLASHAAGILNQIAPAVFLVGSPDLYAGLGYPVVPDLYPGYGPVGAIATALASTVTEWNLVLACDMPAVTVNLLRSLVEAAVGHRTVCAYAASPDGREHPLCGVYHASSRATFDAAVTAGEHRLLQVVSHLSPYVVHLTDFELLRNVNTPEEWDAVAPGAGS